MVRRKGGGQKGEMRSRRIELKHTVFFYFLH